MNYHTPTDTVWTCSFFLNLNSISSITVIVNKIIEVELTLWNKYIVKCQCIRVSVDFCNTHIQYPKCTPC